MDTLLISVIIPVYKTEMYIRKCVDSVRNQTYRNLEIILIDDGSPDQCPEICDMYAKLDDRVKVIHKKNSGLGAARNAGLDIASGDIIAFVDSDDWIDDCAYEKMLSMKNTTGATIVCCAGIRTDGENMYEKILQYKPNGTVLPAAEVTKEILLDKLGSQVVKALYDKKCWNNVRFPHDRLYEDIPVLFQAFEQAETVAFINEPFYKYRINSTGISKTPEPLKTYHIYLGFKERYEHIKIHYPEIIPPCCAMAAHYAISTYFHYYTDAREELEPFKDDVYSFLIENKKTVNFQLMPKSRAYALKLFYLSKKLFIMFCLLLNKTGLQKKFNLNAK